MYEFFTQKFLFPQSTKEHGYGESLRYVSLIQLILVGKTLSSEALSETLTTHKNEKTTLKKLLGELPPDYKGLVLFLFPSAGTPGCTKQACNFTSNHKAFKDKGYEVYGLTSSERTPAVSKLDIIFKYNSQLNIGNFFLGEVD